MEKSQRYKEEEIVYGKEDVSRAPEKLVNFRLLTDKSPWGLETKKFINNFLKPGKDENILDFGSGVCILSEYMAEKKSNAFALEISPDRLMLSINRRKKMKSPLNNICYIQGDCENIPLGNETMDKCLSFEVLHHIPDHRKSLNEVFRVLKKGGIFVINETNAMNPFRRIDELLYRGKNKESSFYMGSLIKDLKNSGFEIQLRCCMIRRDTPNWEKTEAGGFRAGDFIRHGVANLSERMPTDVFKNMLGAIIIVAKKPCK